MKCQTCKNGKMTIRVQNFGEAETSMEIGCIDCDGAGEITETKATALAAMRKRIAEMWCKCGNPSTHCTYHDDAPGSKHHWTCDDCGQVTQVG